MNVVAMSPSTLLGLVIALCFAVGWNTSGCVFALGVMARMGWVALPVGLVWAGNIWVMGLCGLLFVGEFVADKMPGFDVIWNLLHTVVRIPVAGVLAFAVASPLPLGVRVAVMALGMGFAAMAHGGKTALRLAVMPHPEPVWNVLLSLGEEAAAVGLGWMALRYSVEAGLGVLATTVAAVGLGWCGFRRIRAGWRRRFGDRRVLLTGSVADRRAAPSALRRHDNVSLAYASLLHSERGEFLPEVGVDGDT